MERFVLQRLNPRVFPDPEPVMTNLRLLLNHLSGRPDCPPGLIPEIITDRSGNDFFFDEENAAWRALSFIEGSTCLKSVPGPFQVREAGRLLATFHRLTADLSVGEIKDPLPGLHDTPGYLRKYEEVRAGLSRNEDSSDFLYCEDFIKTRQSTAARLAEAEIRGILEPRLIHGDPKLANILFDRRNSRALALIDLDTLKPGLLLNDLGDFLRSSCNRSGEDPVNPGEVSFDLDIFKAGLAGYLEEGRSILGNNEVYYLYEAIRLIPFELGLRFFTDYLQGNVYFKASDGRQNLRRALAQFRLTESIEGQERAIRSVIDAG